MAIRDRYTFRALKLVAILAAGAVVAGACSDNPVKPKIVRPTLSGYLAPPSPFNVLKNYLDAYNNRDSVEMAIVIDDAYQGSSTDPSNPPAINFLKADEIHHMHRLKTDPNIIAVSLDLGPGSSWQRLPGNVSDPPGTAV